MKRLISLILLCALLIGVCFAGEDRLFSKTLHEVCEESGSAGLQQWLDGPLTDNAGVSSEWLVMALSQSGEELDFSKYAAALVKYLDGKTFAASTRQKYALALIACGCADHPFVSAAAEESIGGQGIMSWIFGLFLLQNTTSSSVTESDCVRALLGLEIDGGGWALSGSVPDVDVTAMAVQALASYPEARPAVERAMKKLSGLQIENGGFSGFGGENCESTAQVIMACSALKDGCGVDADACVDALLTYRTGGLFSHIRGGDANMTATVQALLALLSLEKNEVYRFPERTTRIEELPPAEEKAALGYKLPAIIVVVAAALAAAAYVVIAKRNNKNLVFILAAAAALIAAIFLIRIEKPDDYYSDPVSDGSGGSAVISITCVNVAGRRDHIPEDGVILAPVSYEISKGDTVYDLLLKAVRANRIQLDTRSSGDMIYVSGINWLYELEFGELSGWMYSVNGQSPSVGCGSYVLSDGDAVVWYYTLDLGQSEQ